MARATAPWAMDSSGYTTLRKYGYWPFSPATYADRLIAMSEVVGGLAWASPMDWMCEPEVLARTGRNVDWHLRATVESVVTLRELVRGRVLIVPVVQGYRLAEYERCMEIYETAGIDLTREPLVGVGSVCRRQALDEAERVVRLVASAGVRVHAFGFHRAGLRRVADVVASADSMAWSRAGRMAGRPRAGVPPTCARLCRHEDWSGNWLDGDPRDPGRHRNCASCLSWALRWREQVVAIVGRKLRPGPSLCA